MRGAWALGLLLLYLLVAIAARILLHRRRTGSTGFRGVREGAGAAEWSAAVLLVAGFVGSGVAPLLDLVGALGVLPFLDLRWAIPCGLAAFGLGFAGTVWAQAAMGASWRIGVANGEVTRLVTGGPFRLARNPIYSGMMVATLGIVLIVPNTVALASWIAIVLALELQVRVVEEPFLRRLHGDEYARWAERVGRFLPLVGRLTRDPPAPGLPPTSS